MSFFRTALAVVVAAAIYLPSAASGEETACTATFGGRRITIVVPNAAGGGYDTYARAFAPSLSASTGLDVRIVNMPAAGGLAALKRVADAPADELVLLIEAATDIITQGGIPADVKNWMDRLSPLGIVHSDSETWIVRNGVDLTSATHLVASVTSFDGNIVPIVLAAHILGIKVSIVSGYDSSTADIAALLRGEADITSNSLTTALRAVAAGEVKVGMVLSDGPNPAAPSAPYFSGEGGLVWQRSQALPKQEKERRLQLAAAVARASTAARGLFASAGMDQNALACLRDAVGTALGSDTFKTAAEAQKRPIEPQDAEQAAVAIKAMSAAFQETEVYLKEHPELMQEARAPH